MQNIVTQEVLTHTPEETQELARRVVDVLIALEQNRGTSTIVALQGDLGAGKTVFAQGVARALGVEGVVTSPTFVVEKVYRLPDGAPWKHLVHIDAYRLTGEEELHTIGWADIATDPGNLILIEWPEQVGMGVPERAYYVRFEEVDEGVRKLLFNFQFSMLQSKFNV
ncbi:MAG: tRNA (adenosine(37)-N6)-threonylcarbamoyltransferase complex ATPase subunit type 1 TsaE [Candidatus Pacebacteria bacterium]|nr:tRNA (adenosine(37)-N6)-threonylcarbamoyltransferase complex ATPase subunit type 1 TsaE [Candidatus Paceibacterota bacterium]